MAEHAPAMTEKYTAPLTSIRLDAILIAFSPGACRKNASAALYVFNEIRRFSRCRDDEKSVPPQRECQRPKNHTFSG
jgi:hypothetical protein